MILMTIRVPDNIEKMQYATQDDNGYEVWTTLKFGQVISVKEEESDESGK